MAGQARPYRAEHVGSFPRPRALIEAREQHAAGKISVDALREAEDAAIRPIIAMQERVGIGALTDGEFRRASWRDAPFEHLDGFTKERNETDFTFRLFDGSTRKAGPVPSVTGKVRRREPMTADRAMDNTLLPSIRALWRLFVIRFLSLSRLATSRLLRSFSKALDREG